MNFFKRNKKIEENNYAFIDGANLYEGTKHLNWNFDYARFRVWLKEKYSVLLKRTGAKIAYIYDQKSNLETRKEKAPDEDETS